jgi:hypothetical protein
MKKIRIISLVLLILGMALFAIAQTTTQPAERPFSQTTRSEGNNFRRQQNNNFRQRRFERRNNNNGGETASAPTSMPSIYEVVSSRNIFLKGNQRPPPAAPPTPAPKYDGIYRPSASQLVLSGVSLEDNEKVGFLEDQQTTPTTVTRVKIGDTIADGKVVSMTLDALDYKDASGRIIRVEVGFNLAGGDVWGMGASSSSSGGGSTTQPANSAPRLPGESMVDYLKRRRAAESH